MKAWRPTVVESQTRERWRRARVTATFRRRDSDRNPTSPDELDLWGEADGRQERERSDKTGIIYPAACVRAGIDEQTDPLCLQSVTNPTSVTDL